MDPYKVLGISPNSTDDEVKSAYRELARKYHPDNYINNPLSDLAQEKMQQINDAYDTIIKERKNGGRSSSAGSYNQSYSGGYQSGGYGSTGGGGYSGVNANIYNQVRNSINLGNISMAEELLSRVSDRDAEWHFLRSNICYRKGWYDEANREINIACSMQPNNFEYERMRNVLAQSAQYGGYRPMQGSDAMDCCAQMLCCNCLCDCMSGGC